MLETPGAIPPPGVILHPPGLLRLRGKSGRAGGVFHARRLQDPTGGKSPRATRIFHALACEWPPADGRDRDRAGSPRSTWARPADPSRVAARVARHPPRDLTYPTDSATGSCSSRLRSARRDSFYRQHSLTRRRSGDAALGNDAPAARPETIATCQVPEREHEAGDQQADNHRPASAAISH